MNDALLSAEDWVVGYTQPVIGPVSFVLRSSEVVGLIGANGSGKSTLVGGIVGTARTYAGHLQRAPRLKLSLQEQSPPNVRGLPVSARNLLQLAGGKESALPEYLASKLDERLDKLSGGQLQLLRVWASLSSEAELVILDEPTNNLDAYGVGVLHDVLRMPMPQRCVLLISHEAAFLAAVCTRLISLDGGAHEAQP